MNLLLLLGLLAYLAVMVRISVPRIREVMQLREDKRHYSKNFNAGQLDHVEMLLSHRTSSLAFIIFSSLVITLMVILIIFMGDLPNSTF